MTEWEKETHKNLVSDVVNQINKKETYMDKILIIQRLNGMPLGDGVLCDALNITEETLVDIMQIEREDLVSYDHVNIIIQKLKGEI